MVYTFNEPEARTTKMTQYFEILGSRGVYNDGWFAGTLSERTVVNRHGGCHQL